MYFCCIFEKNTNGKHISGAPFLMLVAHPIRGAPKWGAPQILCVAHVIGCATDIMHICGAYGRAPQIKLACGLICVAHARCVTKPQNVAPHIGFLLVVGSPGLGRVVYRYVCAATSAASGVFGIILPCSSTNRKDESRFLERFRLSECSRFLTLDPCLRCLLLSVYDASLCAL
jgi:hypothetical protein